MQKAALLGLSSIRSAIVYLLKPLGKSRRVVFETFLYGVIRPIWSLMPNTSSFTYIASFGGNKIKFRPLVLHDFLFVLANASKNHEPLVQAVFKPKQGQTVVDVGGHIGLYTLKAAKDVGPNGKVVVCEPDPQSYRILKDNVALNNLQNVTVVNAALGDVSGKKTFYASTDPSLSGFELQPKAKLREVTTVRVTTMDELLSSLGIGKVDWIKIDVEGAEILVLRGGKNLLENSSNLNIIVESSDGAAMDYLKQFGFKTRHLGEIYYLATKSLHN